MAQAAADALKEQGNKAFKEGDYAAAEELYTQACQRFSRNPLLFTNRANARLKLQRWEGAVNDCLKSIEISGRAQNHKAYYFLGEFFFFRVLGFSCLGAGLLGWGCSGGRVLRGKATFSHSFYGFRKGDSRLLSRRRRNLCRRWKSASNRKSYYD
jgi:tetratricopeptide (TPR) repeat protein